MVELQRTSRLVWYRQGPRMLAMAIAVALLLACQSRPSSTAVQAPLGADVRTAQQDVVGGGTRTEQTLDQELAVPAAWIEGAKAEGKLIYTTTDDPRELEPQVAAFKQRYPFLEVEHIVASTEVRQFKVLESALRGQPMTDAVTGISNPEYRQLGVLMDLSDLPATRSYPDMLKSADNVLMSRHVRYWAAAYNTNLISKERAAQFKTWFDLTAPDLRGKVAFSSIGSSSWFSTIWPALGPEEATRLLEAFDANDAKFRRERHNASTELLAAGEFAVVIPANEARLGQMKEKGAPVEWLPLEPLPVAPGQIAILKQAPHPNAARLWVNWLLSQEGQRVYSQAAGISPAHPALDASAYKYPAGLLMTQNLQKHVEGYEWSETWTKDHPGVQTWNRVALKGL